MHPRSPRPSRRQFLQTSAAAVAGVTLGPLAPLGSQRYDALTGAPANQGRVIARPVPLTRVRISVCARVTLSKASRTSAGGFRCVTLAS